MAELNLFEEKLVETEKSKYFIIKQTIYEDKLYLFANEIIDEETPSDILAILRVDTKDDKVLITLEKNEKVINDLLAIFTESEL